ncbi:hypothetical protein SG4_31 [Mycobacterium phage SG4]|uniref:Uncharacterized protein n=2 Tax=Cheoctovirus TaxID=1623281 RepID=A0A385DMZ4_9CAUD|nr:hypothetical protein CL94_gp031 [Mycobacterium phage SG4]YP_009956482.1 hypothetical protein I5H32_gp031 [Mycobacterium phage EleanorGeorge]QGJ89537.1 hypothetical protein PBI_ENBY_32 [Mycobacterium phage Enby]QGJ91290.1 hypothetical protein PBI_LORDE_32 [Mycobacterium phage Lorde]AER49441.1 hypothetical protein SG4_31 [Mycobacterium phage SG4]AXQ60731.1 hypothetical protein SEA_ELEANORGEORGE_31 [Mycobacterium phage EleanorGeorge]
MSADPKWLEQLGRSDWQQDECKHCGLEIRSSDGRNWSHAEGPQRGLNRCAVNPYGYDAAPASQACSFACLGSVTGIEKVEQS